MGHLAPPHARHVPNGPGQRLGRRVGGWDVAGKEFSLGVIVPPLPRGSVGDIAAVAGGSAAEERVRGQRQVQRVQQARQALAVTVQGQGLRFPGKQGGRVGRDVERKHRYRHHSVVVLAELHSTLVHPGVFGPQVLTQMQNIWLVSWLVL